MTKEEHKQLLTDFQKAETEPEKMKIMMQLDQDYIGILNERDTALSDFTKVKSERDEFATLNNKLWLENSAQEEIQNTTLPDTDNTPPEKATYGDLESKFEEDYKE
jgi:hypothetical protein